MKVLGTPLGHPRAQIFVPTFREAQGCSATSFGWMTCNQCGSRWPIVRQPRPIILCVVLEPQDVELFARAHDINMRQCLSSILQVNLEQADEETQDSTLPLLLGKLGLRSALRTSKAACWASWADCWAMINERHPEARLMVDELEGVPRTSCLETAASAATELTRVCDFEPPSCGHHRAACARAGVLAGREWALESVVARVCREASGRM